MQVGVPLRCGRSFGDVGAYPVRSYILNERELIFYQSLPEEVSNYVIIRPGFFISRNEEMTLWISPSFLFPLSTGGIIVDLSTAPNDVEIDERLLFEEAGLIYYDSEPSLEILLGDYKSVIETIPNLSLVDSKNDLRVVFDIYRSFDIEINSLQDYEGVIFESRALRDGRVIVKGTVKAGALKKRATEKVFHLCVDTNGAVHCRVDNHMYLHGMIVHT